MLIEPQARIGNLQAYDVLPVLASYDQLPSPDFGFQPVPDGIFHQRLNQHGREGEILHAFRDIESVTQSTPHPNLKDVEVGLYHLHFLSEGSCLPPCLWKGRSQVMDEIREHGFPIFQIGVEQAQDVGEGVEQKVGLNLG